jgi:hypothetical protein
MGLFESILSAASGAQRPSEAGEANPLLGILSGLLTQSGGLQGLASKFHKAARVTHSHLGLAWVRISRFQAIKFKKRLVPTR